MDSIFVYLNPETASEGSGPLQGLKIAIQPNISASGWPTDAGSNALINFKALEDATLVNRLREGGAVIQGLTHMSEFGFGLAGSRAGDAVRRGAVDAELVLDLMGESRLAAQRTSVCGFKPSYGLISRYGLIGLIPSMECCGVLSRSLKNIREVVKIIAGPDERDFALPDEKPLDFSPQKMNPEKTTVGVITETKSGLQGDQEGAFHAAIDELKETGFRIKEMSFPDFSLFSLVHKIVGSVEASSCAGRYDSVRYGHRVLGAKNWNEMYLSSREESFGLLVKSYLFQGAFFQFQRYDAYEDACRIRARLHADMQKTISKVDFLVLPAANEVPTNTTASLAGTYEQFSPTVFANVTGQPALYLPPESGQERFGFQLSGPRLSDARLFALGEHLLNLRQGGK
ncbi:MAG: amidase family protein [Smithella sp.]|jgi:aspartyl-tRNA(Asn)/glutamyl-tRNA(Gln) amidotransferase subunit A